METKKIRILVIDDEDVIRDFLAEMFVTVGHEADVAATGPEGIAMFRTLVSEIPRFKTLARAIFAGGPGETARGLAEFLDHAMSAGRLRKDDPQFAAELLLGMLVGHDRIKRVYGVAKFANGGDARHAARVVDCFLRMYSNEVSR